MKKSYASPEVEFTMIGNDNVICTSECDFDCDSNCSCHSCVGVCTWDCKADDFTCTTGDWK